MRHFKGVYTCIILSTASWTAGVQMAEIVSKSRPPCELSINQKMADNLVVAVLAISSSVHVPFQ